MTPAPLSPTPRSTLNREKTKARYDRTELYHLLDSCFVCHIGVIVDGAPRVLPTGYGRDGDTLLIHGSTGAASLMAAHTGPLSVAVTRLDGVVYARSVFHHSMNFASAIIHARPEAVTDLPAKLDALQVITEHLAPGSWTTTRQPTRKELAKTAVFAIPLHEASVKMRTGPPKDDEADLPGEADWAGVLPIRQVWGAPEPCPLLPDDAEIPRRIASRSASTLPG